MIVRRKKDGNLYHWSGRFESRPNFSRWGACAHLVPKWEGRSHYKTEARFRAEYTREDGSPLS
jgi:hypothetical protein